MKKIEIVQGVMAIVGKIGKAVASLVKGRTKQIVIEDSDMKAEVHKGIGNLRLKEVVASVEGDQQVHIIKRDEKQQEPIAKEKAKVFNIERIRKDKEQVREVCSIQGGEVQQKEVVGIERSKQNRIEAGNRLRRARKLGYIQCYKNKGVQLPLHRLEVNNHKVIYLHQRAPTYMIQRREHGRKRGTGT